MTIDLFVYGTLQLPEVMAAVTGRPFIGVAAQLAGHARYALRRRRYPGIRREDGFTVEGVLYRDVDLCSLARLDAFEDRFYRRRRVAVLLGAGVSVPAEVYLIEPANYRLLDRRKWDLVRFRQRYLKSYLRHCRRGFSAAPAVQEATGCAVARGR